MNRREFLKFTAIMGAGLSVPGGISDLISPSYASEKIDLAVVHGPSASVITKAAIDALGGISKFISRFRYIEMKAAEKGRHLSDMTLKEMDSLWDEAKAKEK